MNEDQERLKLQEQIKVLEAAAKQWLSAEAIVRFGALKAAHPERALQVSALIAQLGQQGQLKEKLTDADLKALLVRLTPEKKETRIRRV